MCGGVYVIRRTFCIPLQLVSSSSDVVSVPGGGDRWKNGYLEDQQVLIHARQNNGMKFDLLTN